MFKTCCSFRSLSSFWSVLSGIPIVPNKAESGPSESEDPHHSNPTDSFLSNQLATLQEALRYSSRSEHCWAENSFLFPFYGFLFFYLFDVIELNWSLITAAWCFFFRPKNSPKRKLWTALAFRRKTRRGRFAETPLLVQLNTLWALTQLRVTLVRQKPSLNRAREPNRTSSLLFPLSSLPWCQSGYRCMSSVLIHSQWAYRSDALEKHLI